MFTSHQGTPDVLAKMQWGEFFNTSLNPGHYDVAKTFGRDNSNVTFGVDGAKAKVSIATPAATANEAVVTGTSYNPIGHAFDDHSVRTKIHHSDVVLIGSDDKPITLTEKWKAFTANTLNKSSFFDQSGNFACTFETGANVNCALALDHDGFIKIAPIKTTAAQVNAADFAITLAFTSQEDHTALASKTIEIHRPDTTYMTMGYWMDGEGSKFTVNTFATARYWYGDVNDKGEPINEKGLTRNADGKNNIGMVAGTARYSGDAVGIYVMNKGGQNEIDIYNGEFTADADLTADFGRRVNDNDDPFKVSGTITGFDSITRDSDDLSSWRLTLNESAVNQSSGHFSGTTTGGRWQGQFYGNAGRETAAEDDNYPVAAVGEFSGDFGNHNEVVGVFGVEKD